MSDRSSQELDLFDLPLTDPAHSRSVAPTPKVSKPQEESSDRDDFSLFADLEPEPADEPSDYEDSVVDTGPTTDQGVTGARIFSGLIDSAVIGGMMLIIFGASAAIGTAPRLDAAPGYLAFLLVFSFLYWVVPLSFWGQTPGMAWTALASRNHDGCPLSFRQAVVRWAAVLVTVLTMGIPLLLLVTGRSLSDRLSGTPVIRRG